MGNYSEVFNINSIDSSISLGSLNISLLVIAIIYAVLSVIVAIFRKSSRARFRCITVILSSVIAFVAVLVAKDSLPAIFETYLLPLIENIDPEIAEYYTELTLNASENTITVIGNFTCSLISPLMFLVLFIALSVATWVLYFVITLVLFFVYHKKKRRPVFAMIWGLIQAFVVVFSVMIPIGFYLEVSPIVLDSAMNSEIIDDDTIAVITEQNASAIDMIYELNDDSLVSFFRNIGGKKLYDSLTKISANGASSSVTNELSAISDFYFQATSLASSDSDFNSYTSKEANILRNMSNTVQDSVILPTVAGELVYMMQTSWDNGESFFGIEKPTQLGEAQALFDNLISTLASDAHNASNFSEDLSTITEVFAIIIEENVISDNYEQVIYNLGTSDTIYRIADVLSQNPRTSHIVSDVITLSMTYISNHLFSGLLDEAYADLVSSIALTLINSAKLSEEERADAVNDGLYYAFEATGIAVSDEVLDRYTEELIALYDDNGHIAAEELVNGFFNMYSSGFGTDDSSEND